MGRRLNGALLVSALLVVGMSTTANGEILVNQPRVGFSTTDGMISQTRLGFRGFDNFVLDTKSEIRGVSFSFAALGGSRPTFANNKWNVKFYESNGLRRGALIKGINLNASSPAFSGTTSDAVFYDFDYQFSANDRFMLNGNTEYWVSIASRVRPEDTTALWAAAGEQGDGSQWRVGQGTYIPSSADRAFALQGVRAVPEVASFATAALYGIIGIGLLLGLRMRRKSFAVEQVATER